MKHKNHIFYHLICILVIGILFLALFLNNSANVEVKQLNEDEFSSLIENESVFLLNTHIPYEGEIEGTDLIIKDWENINLYVDKLPEDKSMPIAVYCRSGRMSAEAAKQLVSLGYKNVYNLEGGMNAWRESGREIVKNE